jgi:hypothetical protein
VAKVVPTDNQTMLMMMVMILPMATKIQHRMDVNQD